jgi:hypothetical protein
VWHSKVVCREKRRNVKLKNVVSDAVTGEHFGYQNLATCANLAEPGLTAAK